ncbi:MAG: hypothetical protein IKD19_00920, partial [Prevotella sp.]|nr:hypothetical protein [Prevotella sp.]
MFEFFCRAQNILLKYHISRRYKKLKEDMPLFSDEDRRRYFGSRLQGKRTTFLSKSKAKTRGNLLKSKPKAKIQTKTRENLLKSKPKANIQTKNKGKSAKIQTKKAATYLQATALIHYSILCSNTLLPFNKYFILN